MSQWRGLAVPGVRPEGYMVVKELISVKVDISRASYGLLTYVNRAKVMP